MGEILQFRGDRVDMIDERGRLCRATWHCDDGVFVVSLWRDGTCVGTVRLQPRHAAQLANFITTSLADLTDREPADNPASSPTGL